MKKISLKNLTGIETLSKEELIKVEGGKKLPPATCYFTDGSSTQCYTQTQEQLYNCQQVLELTTGKEIDFCSQVLPD